MTAHRFVTRSTPRIDGAEKITGAAPFVDDLDFGPDLLHAQIVASPHAHARILAIDTFRAEQVPGVVTIVTGKRFPATFGLYMKDRHIFAQDRVRFVGEQVAAVIAHSPKAAKRAAQLVSVTYEELPAVIDPVTALEDDAERIHPDLADYPHVPWFYPQAGTNIAHWRKLRRGDVEAGFGDADVVLEDTYTVPRYAHAAIEPHAVVAQMSPAGRLTVWSASQSPYTQRNLFAEALGLSHQDIRVVTPYVGGGFGGKAGVTMEIMGAALATAVKGHPVKLHWTREQEFVNTYQRQGVVAHLRMGARRDGTITALEHTLHWDAGAYVEYGANVVNAAGISATGPYRIDNVRLDSVCIYTNLPPGGPYRGFGYSEFTFGLESHLDRLADELGIDPVELRRRNAIVEGDELPYGASMNPSGLLESIDRAAAAIDWGVEEPAPAANIRVGKGVAAFWKAPAMPPNAGSAAFLKFNEDGSINLTVSGMEIGQGYLTAMAQIAAEVLSVPPERIRVETPDTDRNAYEWQTVASHVTWSCGNAVLAAATEAREKILGTVCRVTGYDPASLYLDDEMVRSTDAPQFALALRDFVIGGLEDPSDGTFKGGPVVASGSFMPEFTSTRSDPETGQGGKPNVHYTVGAAGLVLEVDVETGKVHVRKVALAVDAGTAINPVAVEGQVAGGVLQGLATALYEDLRFDKEGRLLNPTLTDYKLPTALDIPDEIVPIIVEVPQPDGPFGARGVGEHTMIPVAPLVANAIHDAVGIRITSMPITAEKLFLRLDERR
ncbi:MAG: xanthine dehydrogenase family protein molybdopterin-binding subunit [Nitriliruptoraceae bacterium]